LVGARLWQNLLFAQSECGSNAGILGILGAQLPQVLYIRHFGRFDPGWKKVSQATQFQISRKIPVSSMQLFENRPERLLEEACPVFGSKLCCKSNL